MRDIFIVTIAHHLTLKDLCNYFGPRLRDLFHELTVYMAKKELNKSSKVLYNNRQRSLTIEYSGSMKSVVAPMEELWK